MGYRKQLAENVLFMLATVAWVVADSLAHWSAVVWRRVARCAEDVLYDRIKHARDYDEWLAFARQLDIVTGNNEWRADPASKDYDYKFIASRLHSLRIARQNKDVSSMIYRLRAGLLRNLAGITHVNLFNRSMLGTKKLIEDYIEEVVSQLEYIGYNDIPELQLQAKIEFFTDTRQSFGNTALFLHGGATFGLYHLGVVKCLNEHALLPRIISGTSVGALIAALVCIHTDDELPDILKPDGINLKAFAVVGTKGSVRRKLNRLITQGYLMNVKVLEDCVRANVGDITFEKTKRVLNIVVSSQRKNMVPRLLNYLTAPNVLIWSAACASCAVSGLYDSVSLLAKDKSGHIVAWHPSEIKWTDASMDSDSPASRLAELFNVNHMIVSQANPYMLPFMSRQRYRVSLFAKLRNLFFSEIRHRLTQLNEFGLLPSLLRVLVEQQYTGHVTIFPDIHFSDYGVLLSNPTSTTLSHWIGKGEHATWSKLALIRSRCAIELAFDRILLHLKPERSLPSYTDNLPHPNRDVDMKKRTKSVH